ncbi:MAG: putative DNA binding domain-containing protein, partial [Chlorobi bacterium]|nr:putative DNA binding domain-containing protein [Chlorobiota bacterium]
MSNIIELIKLGESKTLELKKELPKNSSIAKSIIAFSNTSGGRLIIGVDDNRETVGIEDDNIFEIQDKIASLIFDNCHPNILPEIYTINHDGILLLVVEVFRGNLLPYYFKNEGKANGTYMRIGATNRVAGPENIAELERQKNQISYDEEINYEFEYQEIDTSPLLKSFETHGKKLDEQKFKNLKLVKDVNGKLYPTNALLILLGLMPHCTVKCGLFKGTNMDVFIDKKEFAGDLYYLLNAASGFILNHINLNAEVKGMKRDDLYELPLVALREALVNALIHRDYSNQGRDIKIGIYDDMVNIVSPGGFPNTITAEDINEGRSDARNKVIANVFKELNLVEQWGSGIKRIKSSCLELGLKEPNIQEKNDFVDVELWRPQATANDRKRPQTTANDRKRPVATNYDRLSPDEEQIINYILENGRINRTQAKEMLPFADTKIKEILNGMMKKSQIKRVGVGR